MKTTHLIMMARRLFLAAIGGGALLTLASAPALAAPGGGGTPISCDGISPTSGTQGSPVNFSVSLSGGRGGKTYAWTFSGPATPTSSSNANPSVTYNSTGTYGVSVHVTDKSGECTDNANITIGLATNDPPTANPDSYNATDGQTLSVGAPGVLGNDNDESPATLTAVLGADVTNGNLILNADGSFTYDYTGSGPFPDTDSFTYRADDGVNPPDPAGNDTATVTITIAASGAAFGTPVGRGDTYATPVGTALNVVASRVSGVLYNDFDTDPATGDNIGNTGLTAVKVSDPTSGSLTLNADGSFSYTPSASLSDNANDSFTYVASDGTNDSAITTVNINILSKQTDFKILMNYELGMHCTGFEFAYCCVLPPYNSILAQVVKPQSPGDPVTGGDFPRLLEGDHNNHDDLGRPVVVRDAALDGSGNFTKYFLEYYHDAQPRYEGQGTTQTSTLISAAENNSLFYTSTVYDSAATDSNGKLLTAMYSGVYGVVVGDDLTDGDLSTGTLNEVTDNYANGWMNHFYIFEDPLFPNAIGPNLEGHNSTGTTQEGDKYRLGVAGARGVQYPADVGAGLHPLGPTGSAAPFDNVLTFSGDTGTVVYTQMKVLENLPVMLTSPHIWEALGLPLTPFEDSIDFFGDPGAVDEDSIRPYVAMKARLHVANCDADGLNCTQGNAVIGSNGKPVIGHGTAPIDIPNCERCHSVPATDGQGNPNKNSPSWIRAPLAVNPLSTNPFAFPHSGGYLNASLEAVTTAEKSFWDAYYDIIPGVDSDWYSRLKGAAVNMLALHDFDQGTSFTAKWPAVVCNNPDTNPGDTDCSYKNDPPGPLSTGVNPSNPLTYPQNTRLGKESVICQKCHADNVIAVVKSACTVDPSSTVLCPDDSGPGTRKIIRPITEAIHWRHREVSESDNGVQGSIDFADATGRSGGCQGCHPAHRSDGVMDGYPITVTGDNAQELSDNRLAAGGCFVGRDVHSNSMKDVDGAETPAHLNAVGQWLSDVVFNNQDGVAGVGGHDTRGLWCTNCHTQLGQEIWKAENCVDLINGNCITNPRGEPTLAAVAAAVGVSENQAIAWLDPNANDIHGTGLGDFTHAIWNPDVTANPDAAVALIEATFDSNGCNPNVAPNEFELPRFNNANACLSFDGDPGGVVPGAGDPSVRILDFCTTQDCMDAANNFLLYEGTCQLGENAGQVCSTEGTCQGGTNAGQACATDGSIGADCSTGGGTCVSNGIGTDCSVGGGACARNSTGLSFAFAAPFDAATDGRDHWLSPGEPHCADCHAAPYVEPSGGNIGEVNMWGDTEFKPPFNYPRKASLMRYSTGHQGVTCQGCHESIHGLYPVTPTIDTTTYAQAAALNHDGSHGPLKCGTCHTVDSNGIPTWIKKGTVFGRTFDDVVTWAHTYTEDAVPQESTCLNCHQDRSPNISESSGKWLRHSFVGRIGRLTQDKAEIAKLGHVAGDPDPNGTPNDPTDDRSAVEIANLVCASCHAANQGAGAPSETGQQLLDRLKTAGCSPTWKQHLVQGRLSEVTWEFVSKDVHTSTCGW